MNTARLLDKSSASMPYDIVVVGLHLRWDGVYQRPQHLLSRIAQHTPVFVVEEPLVDGKNLHEWIVDGQLNVLRPHRQREQFDAIDDLTIAELRARIGQQRPLIWLYTPMMLELANAFRDAPLVFDAMDELAQFAQADPRLAQRERALLARAATVFCGGPSLYRQRVGRSQHVKLYASGVDVDFFEQARELAPHRALAAARRPIFGYIGVIDERVDLELVAAIADARPEATVAMIGPTAKIDASALPQRRNIVYLGQQRYADLPAFLAAVDVAIMPFALNESTHNISPTKTLEYLAAGKPVVSTAVPDVVSEYANLVSIADGHAAFISALANAPQLAVLRQAKADERTRAANWDAIAASMLRDLETQGIVSCAPGLRDIRHRH